MARQLLLDLNQRCIVFAVLLMTEFIAILLLKRYKHNMAFKDRIDNLLPEWCQKSKAISLHGLDI